MNHKPSVTTESSAVLPKKNHTPQISQFVGTPNKGRRFWIAVGLSVLALALIITLVGVIVYQYVFSEYEQQVLEVNRENISLSEKAPQTQLFHVAVFGIDSQSQHVGRADSIMIFTIDMEHKQLKLTSILRDSYVPIEGHGEDKINHAYAYGGAELMLSTINRNFDMNISEYVVLDFADVAKLVDAVGGLDLEVTAAEIEQINGMAASMGSTQKLYTPGFAHLNGAQVVSYGRIRTIDNEAARSGRQRIVIQKLMDKLLEKEVFEYPKLLHDFLPEMETTLSMGEVTSAALDASKCSWNIKEYVVPSAEDEAEGGIYEGAWLWRYDLDAATKRWHNFLETEAKE